MKLNSAHKKHKKLIVLGCFLIFLVFVTAYYSSALMPKAAFIPKLGILKESTCSELGGLICAYEEACYGTRMYASDSRNCCVGICKENSPPVINAVSPDYKNYWVRSNQDLLFSITDCSDADGDKLYYKWEVDGKFVSMGRDFILNASSHGVGKYEITGYCFTRSSDPDIESRDHDSYEFSLEIIDERDFTLIALPDTQKYSQHYPYIFSNQTQWISELRDGLNIKFVTHEGDVVNDGSDIEEWEIGNRSMSILDGVVPYGLAIGNHDYDDRAKTRNATYWNAYFNHARYSSNSWWGGSYENNNENTYQQFSGDESEFMIMHLEFCPRDEILEWANQTAEDNSDKKIIITTHSYMYPDNTRVNDSNLWNCSRYGIGGNNGEEQWDKFVKNHENIFLVLSGHIFNDGGTGYLESLGVNGNKVHQILANYQAQYMGGGGYLRILRFSPTTQNRVFVRTYSPYLDRFKTTSGNEFSFEFIPGLE